MPQVTQNDLAKLSRRERTILLMNLQTDSANSKTYVMYVAMICRIMNNLDRNVISKMDFERANIRIASYKEGVKAERHKGHTTFRIYDTKQNKQAIQISTEGYTLTNMAGLFSSGSSLTLFYNKDDDTIYSYTERVLGPSECCGCCGDDEPHVPSAYALNLNDGEAFTNFVHNINSRSINSRYYVLDTLVSGMTYCSYPLAATVAPPLLAVDCTTDKYSSSTARTAFAGILTAPLWLPLSIAVFGITAAIAAIGYVATMTVSLCMLLVDAILIKPIKALRNCCTPKLVDPIEEKLAENARKTGDTDTPGFDEDSVTSPLLA